MASSGLGLREEVEGVEGGGQSSLRLKTEDIRQPVGFVSCAVGLLVDGSDSIHEVYTGHPLVNGELDLAGEVVEMADQGAEDLAVPGGCLGPHVVDDGLGEVWIEPVGSHFVRGCVRMCRSVCVGDWVDVSLYSLIYTMVYIRYTLISMLGGRDVVLS